MTRCTGCNEARPLDHGKCLHCWRVEAVYLRTNIGMVNTVLEATLRRPNDTISKTRLALDILDVLRVALVPLDRAMYLKGRGREDDGPLRAAGGER